MKIGILTFHWATNYGAVLQCYALQEYLKEQGHIVEIINYKPWHFDFWYKYVRRPWLLKNLGKDLFAHKKEEQLIKFRAEFLHLTQRYYTSVQMAKAKMDYDIVISGSDQVLNESFTLFGENHPTPAYYLQAFPNSKRIGYAESFGCNEYSSEALQYAKQWINNFDKVGVREQTGLGILDAMGFKGPREIVPDPTLLRGRFLFKDIKIEFSEKQNYLCTYILRKHIDLHQDDVIYIDDYNNPISMEQWLGTILGSRGLITNSYHGMIVAILNHIPFAVLADAGHMNDRFVTLLTRLGLMDRLSDTADKCVQIVCKPIDWVVVDKRISDFQKLGRAFLN